MKTLKQVLEERPDHEKLIKAVIKRLGMDSVPDVLRGGIDGGFNGFIYYRDTVKFFKKYRKEILALAKEQSNEMGVDLLSMIQNFNCLTSGSYPNKKPDYGPDEIGEAIFGQNFTDYDTIQNAMAWYAAEEVCRMFEE